ncbi:MAG: helix-turn-helix domain-containing protein [Komagataeibacter hansenii]|nr:helix-turn-helix domain-containing protein [Novacetimonas hansenii]
MDTREIIRLAGGPSKVARASGRHHATVIGWARIPAEHVLTIARMSGISPHEIRPDVFGSDPAPADAHGQTSPWWKSTSIRDEQRGAA